ncbi:MAG TPA: hypothetical protein PLN53_09565 [Terricaulis sp.]|nr:hypothetical protein [Terricaulis sp.]
MSRYTMCVTCACGAKYERGEVRLPIRDIGIQECNHCGDVIERWHGKVVPIFRFVSAPQSKKVSAA